MPDIETPTAMTIRQDAVRHAIAGEVRAEMARKNKTLRDVAEILGMDHTSVHRRVRGEVSFRAEELVLLADFLDVPAEQFVRIGAVAAAVTAA